MARFLTLQDVAEILHLPTAQVYALVRTGELQAVKVGGRGQWRVEQVQLERWLDDNGGDGSRVGAPV